VDPRCFSLLPFPEKKDSGFSLERGLRESSFDHKGNARNHQDHGRSDLRRFRSKHPRHIPENASSARFRYDPHADFVGNQKDGAGVSAQCAEEEITRLGEVAGGFAVPHPSRRPECKAVKQYGFAWTADVAQVLPESAAVIPGKLMQTPARASGFLVQTYAVAHFVVFGLGCGEIKASESELFSKLLGVGAFTATAASGDKDKRVHDQKPAPAALFPAGLAR
jgi:hypothetical protein